MGVFNFSNATIQSVSKVADRIHELDQMDQGFLMHDFVQAQVSDGEAGLKVDATIGGYGADGAQLTLRWPTPLLYQVVDSTLSRSLFDRVATLGLAETNVLFEVVGSSLAGQFENAQADGVLEVPIRHFVVLSELDTIHVLASEQPEIAVHRLEPVQ